LFHRFETNDAEQRYDLWRLQLSGSARCRRMR
jgi:hypothetical protein